MGKFEYTYSIDQIDEYNKKKQNGIIVAADPQMELEAKIRLQELHADMFDDDEEFASEEDIKRYNEMMAKRIDKERHKAHKKDIKMMKISDKQKEKLFRAVSSSIVRPMYSSYNKSDEELYGDAERKKIMEKLQNLKSIVRNQFDFRNAINIISEAIEYSLDHDYPYMRKEEVYEAWKNGDIKFNYNIPKLFSDYVHEITDKETLKGIADGSITMMSKRDIDAETVRVDYSKSPLVEYEYEPVTPDEYRRMAELHRKGVSTPLSVMFDSKGKIYNQFRIPSGNIFADKDNSKNPDGSVMPFDWLAEDAWIKYYERMHNIDPSDPKFIINIMNSANDSNLSLEFRNKIIKGDVIKVDTNNRNGMIEEQGKRDPMFKDDRTLQLERDIFQSIQDAN